jgi:cholesterol oxidase
MRGHISTVAGDDYAAAEARGKDTGTILEFTVTVAADSWEEMLQQPGHRARLDGTINCPSLSATPLTVSNGAFSLLVRDPQRVNSRLMTYDMVGETDDGRRFRLEGFKVIHDDRKVEIWADTTTLFVTLTELGTPGRQIAKGILHILPADFLKQMTTMAVTGTSSPIEKLKGLAAFGKFFAGELFDTYGGVFVRSNELRPDAGAPREKRPLRMSAPDVHFFDTADGTTLKLTRYQGGSKGPVLLAPGFGTSTLAYTIDTVDTNLPEALFAAGYDIWLFDYRASPDLASSHTQFTLDDVATKDWPAAVEKVRELTGAESVQVMAHCVGSLTFLMALLSGLKGVRSGISSALSFFPISTMANKIRADLDLGTAAAKAGLKSVTTDFDSQQFQDKFIDAVLKLFPSHEQCTSAVCRRILGIYGDVYKHDQLNEATHQAIHEMFGIGNLSAFNHISRMVREGKAVDKDGKDVYLPNLSKVDIPITFVHGAENNLFLPENTTKALKALAAAGNAQLFQRIEFPNYAHMDCYIGRDAARDIFPTIVAELDRFNEAPSHARASGTR